MRQIIIWCLFSLLVISAIVLNEVSGAAIGEKEVRGFGCNGPFDHNEYQCNAHCKSNGVSNKSVI